MTTWRGLPPLTALRAFAAYAETGNMAQAGAALNVSHAAISQQVKSLEAHLGLPLVDRSGREASLTPQGQRLSATLSHAFSEMSQTIEDLTGTAGDRPLQISATPSFAAAWLMPRLADFRAAHPGISLMIDPSAEVKTLSPGGIDVAIRYGAGHWPGLDAQLLIASPIVVVAATDLVGARSDLGPDDLRDLPWLQEIGTSETTDWLARQGVEGRLKHGITSFPGNLMLEAARAGQGVAITARVFAEADIAAGRLRLLFQSDEAKGYHIVTRPGVLRPPARAFATWLRRQAALDAG